MHYFPMNEVFLARVTTLPAAHNADVSAETKVLGGLISSAIETAGIDERRYFDLYPDVEEEVNAGRIQSATQHFAHHGYFERRIGVLRTFDSAFYMQRYPDLDFLLDEDSDKGPVQHFLEFGWREWRLPCEAAEAEAEVWRKALTF
jgi:hypothetical protein